MYTCVGAHSRPADTFAGGVWIEYVLASLLEFGAADCMGWMADCVHLLATPSGH